MKERQRWQPEEDALLRAYVKQYGPKEWTLLSQRMGRTLDRDPKSCLERWKNYLKPGIKKGSLTPEEQTLVISLQSKYGNKWKKIAAEVPGRTAKRLGKWWEVFKEKQLKQHRPPEYTEPATVGSPDTAMQGKYDHILETFAEKYVMQPRILAYPPVPVLGSERGSVLPAWMNTSGSKGSAVATSSASNTSSPFVNLTLSPSEPVVLDPVQSDTSSNASRFLPFQLVGNLVQYCKEVEEGRMKWMQHRQEATWRLNRLEQKLESEKARKIREKMEEIEAKIRNLREEEMDYRGRLENEYRDKMDGLQREAERNEAKIMEAWTSKKARLVKLVEQIGVYRYGGFTNLIQNQH